MATVRRREEVREGGPSPAPTTPIAFMTTDNVWKEFMAPAVVNCWLFSSSDRMFTRHVLQKLAWFILLSSTSILFTIKKKLNIFLILILNTVRLQATLKKRWSFHDDSMFCNSSTFLMPKWQHPLNFFPSVLIRNVSPPYLYPALSFIFCIHLPCHSALGYYCSGS